MYQSLRALESGRFQGRLIRYIYEIKSIVVNGEFAGIPKEKEDDLEEASRYAVSFIVKSSVEKLYTFTVNDKVLAQLGQIAQESRKRTMDKSFKSLEVLDKMCVEKV